jgi:putative zinc finger protein
MKLECHEAELMMIDYLDNKISAKNRRDLEAHLASCEVCSQALPEYKELLVAIDRQPLQQPTTVLRDSFETMLQSELNILATTKIIRPEKKPIAGLYPVRHLVFKVAACLVLISCGAFIGGIVIRNKDVQSTKKQVAALQSEVKDMRETVMLKLLSAESASDRIKALTYVEQMSNPGDDVIKALIETLNLDENVNVRLAALSSVSRFTGKQVVRDSLVNSLRNQKEPIVQIILINILADKKETKAIGAMREIISNKATIAPVKDAAEKGLKSL